MSQAITYKGAVVTQDGVIIQVQVFASGIWSIPLEGCIVGAGKAWHWHSITASWVVGGFAIVASHGAGWPCHWWVTHNFMDGGMHIWGWGIMELKREVDDHSLGDHPFSSCSHHWGGLGGQA